MPTQTMFRNCWKKLLAETEKITGRSRWSVGKVEGKLLQMLIKISNAKRVVEVGTFTGYSALVMAEALPEDGILTTWKTAGNLPTLPCDILKKVPMAIKFT